MFHLVGIINQPKTRRNKWKALAKPREEEPKKIKKKKLGSIDKMVPATSSQLGYVEEQFQLPAIKSIILGYSLFIDWIGLISNGNKHRVVGSLNSRIRWRKL